MKPEPPVKIDPSPKPERGIRRGRMKPATAGVLAIVVIAIGTFFGFTHYNPLSRPYTFTATFRSANELQPGSPVRLAGVSVGEVTDVRHDRGGTGAADVTMKLDDRALPIKRDAELKIRPRLFLEGNFFVDLQPGTPSSANLPSGGRIPVNQTATPVQIDQVLTAFQSDTRADLKTLLDEYAVKALGGGGAAAFNRALRYAPDAERFGATANGAALGTRPHDLSRVIRAQGQVFDALARQPRALRDLVTSLNRTAAAFASQPAALRRSIPALRDVVVGGRPGLESLDAALPSLRAFSREALPAVRSSGPTIDASLPLIAQTRRLVSPAELGGLAADLRPTVPALARINRSQVPLLTETRALSRCQNKVVLPFATTDIPDPDFPDNTGPWYKQNPQGLVGLSGESRLFDANIPIVHVQAQSGPTSIINTQRGEDMFAQAPQPLVGVRPTKPAHRPQIRPGVPCETQEPADLNAPGGPAERSVTPGGGQPVPPPDAAAARREERAHRELNGVLDFLARDRKGLPAVDPMTVDRHTYLKRLDKLGLRELPNGHVKSKAAKP
jgi:phospholipid/cholesterol/gamma-HCH transport system substrate-binding protein